PEAGLVELAAELRPPGAGRVERRVLDAVNVGGELDPLLVERAHALAGEVGDREAELEDHVLAGPRTERAGPGGEPAHVVAGQDDHGKGNPGLRLELLDEGTAQRGLLVEQDRLQAELHEEARDLLLHLPVPPVHDEHLAVRSRLRTGARRIGIEDARAEPELLRHRLELAEIRLQILALIRYAPLGAAGCRAAVPEGSTVSGTPPDVQACAPGSVKARASRRSSPAARRDSRALRRRA